MSDNCYIAGTYLSTWYTQVLNKCEQQKEKKGKMEGTNLEERQAGTKEGRKAGTKEGGMSPSI